MRLEVVNYLIVYYLFIVALIISSSSVRFYVPNDYETNSCIRDSEVDMAYISYEAYLTSNSSIKEYEVYLRILNLVNREYSNLA